MYTIAGSLPMASAIILLPFYLEYLSTDNFGALSIYLAFSALVQVLVTFSFDTSIYIHYHDFKDDKERLSVFTSSVFVFIIIIGISLGTILTIAGDLVFRLLKSFINVKGEISFYPFGLMSVGSAICQSIFKVYCSFLQTRQKPQIYFWANLGSFTMIAGLTVAGLHLFPETLIGPIGGRLIAFFVSALWVLLMVFKEFGYHFDYPTLKSSFGFNKASLVYQLQQWSINYLDRFVMIFFLPLSQIGVYDFAVKCMMGIDFVISGLFNSFFPKVIALAGGSTYKQSTLEINRYYNGLNAVMMVLVCLAVVTLSFAIDFKLIGKGYQASLEYLPFIGIYYLLRGIRYFFISPYSVLKYVKPLMSIYLIVSIIKIGIAIIFVREIGVYAVVFGTIISSIIELLLLVYFIRHRFVYKFNYLKLIISPFILIVMLVSASFLNESMRQTCYIIYPFVCGGILWWLYKNELRSINLPFVRLNK